MRYLGSVTLRRKVQLTSGCISEEHFNKLKEISSIHSKKVLLALEDYCVCGSNRKSACAKFNVSQGYFSICLRRLQQLHANIMDIIPYYISMDS
ncbi:TPA: transcriptional regulator [Escherichia coli]|nr:transcriptional regulator [Escherichia coli]